MLKNLLNSILISLVLLQPAYAQSWGQSPPLEVKQCSHHTQIGLPKTKKQLTLICRTGYLSGYDAEVRLPNYTVYEHKPHHGLGCEGRSGTFFRDKSVKNGVTPIDYYGLGYDKGHLTPAADMGYSTEAEYESFLMTNAAPQAPSLNRGLWRELEFKIRSWSYHSGNTLIIYTGVIYTDEHLVSRRQIKIPTHFYKIVVDIENKQIAGWLMPNVNDPLMDDPDKYRTLIKIIETSSGNSFDFKSEFKELKLSESWKYAMRDFLAARRNKCGRSND